MEDDEADDSEKDMPFSRVNFLTLLGRLEAEFPVAIEAKDHQAGPTALKLQFSVRAPRELSFESKPEIVTISLQKRAGFPYPRFNLVFTSSLGPTAVFSYDDLNKEMPVETFSLLRPWFERMKNAFR